MWKKLHTEVSLFASSPAQNHFGLWFIIIVIKVFLLLLLLNYFV